MISQKGTSNELETFSRKLREVWKIQDLCMKVHSCWQLPDMFRVIPHTLDNGLGFKQSMIYLLGEDGETLRFQLGWGYPEGYVGNPVRLGEGFVGVSARSDQVFRNGNLGMGFHYNKNIRSRNASAYDSMHPESMSESSPKEQYPESLMVIPLRSKKGVSGVIVVESPNINAFDHLDQELLKLVAAQMGQIIDEVRREAQVQRHWQGLFYAKENLMRLHAFLDSVVPSESLTFSASFTAELAMQMIEGWYGAETSELTYSYFEQAADIFHDIGMALELVKSRLNAAFLILPGCPNEAIEMLQACLKGLETCKAVKYAEYTRSLLLRLKPPENTGLQQLTKRERQVAILLSQHLSNQAIAEQLTISVRTVTTHAERIYSKLGLRTRIELSRYIQENT